MAIQVDLKQYIKTYGNHKIKVIATGEGFRNSVPVEKEYTNALFILYTDDGIQVTNVQPNVSSLELLIDGASTKTVDHDITATDDVVIPLTDTTATADTVNLFKVTAHTTYGDFESNEVKTTKILGVSGMYDTAIALTRTDDAVNKTFSIDTDTGIVTSDFDSEFPYNEMTEVTVDDSVFISIPEMWWRIGKDDEGNITDIAVARYKKGYGNWYQSDAFLVGKYLSYQENNKMVSKTGKSASQNYSASQWTTYATANGDGYKPYGCYEHTVLTFLWLIEFANKRSNNVLQGYGSYNLTPTGTTDTIEAVTGYLKANNRMKYRGIEDFVGNDYVWLPDINSAYYTAREVDTYKSGTSGRKQLSYYKNVTTSNNWRNIQALGWDDNNPFICLPSKIGSSTSTTEYFGSAIYGPTGNTDCVARAKAYAQHATYATLVTSIFEYSYSGATDTTTSRLIKY